MRINASLAMPNSASDPSAKRASQRALHQALEERRQGFVDELERLKTGEDQRGTFRTVTTLLGSRYRAAGLVARAEILDAVEFLMIALRQL